MSDELAKLRGIAEYADEAAERLDALAKLFGEDDLRDVLVQLDAAKELEGFAEAWRAGRGDWPEEWVDLVERRFKREREPIEAEGAEDDEPEGEEEGKAAPQIKPSPFRNRKSLPFPTGSYTGPEGPYRSPYGHAPHYLVRGIGPFGYTVFAIVQNNMQVRDGILATSLSDARQWLKDNWFELQERR